MKSLKTILIFLLIITLLSACSYNVNYKTKEINNFSDKSLFYYIKVNNDHKSFNVCAYIKEDKNVDLSSVSLNQFIIFRPVINNDFLHLNSIQYSQRTIFEINNKLFEERLNCNSIIYKIERGNLVEISNKKQKNKLILDVFEFDNSYYLLYEDELYKDGKCLLKMDIIKTTPLRVKGIINNKNYIFPTVNGIYSYDLDAGNVKLIKEEKMLKSSFAEIIYTNGKYYLITENIQAHYDYFDKNANTLIEEYDKDFNLINSKKIDSGLDLLSAGNKGFIKTYLHKKHSGEYIIKSDYILYEDLSTEVVNDYQIDFDEYAEKYRTAGDNIDEETFYKYYSFETGEYAYTPVWNYDAKQQKFLMIDPYNKNIINSFNEEK